MKRNWTRIGDRNVCPVCGHRGWCLKSDDDSAICCARVQSDRQMGKAGWIHEVGDRPRWTVVKTPKPRRPLKELQKVAEECYAALDDHERKYAAWQTNSSATALTLLRVGVSSKWNGCISYPMRDETGQVVGIRYRSPTGKKWSEPGSRDGMFYNPDSLVDRIVVLEGATDTAALMSLRFHSVVGRSACTGNVEQLSKLCIARGIMEVLIIPDTDEVGRRGAMTLAKALLSRGVKCCELLLPVGVKDVRVQKQKNPEWLRLGVERFFEPIPALQKASYSRE